MRKIITANISHYKKASSFDFIAGEVQRVWNEEEGIKDNEILEGLRVLETEGLISLFGQNRNVKPTFKLVRDLADD